MARIGVVAIVITGGREKAAAVQNVLSEYGDIIMGRMGIPNKKHGINCISLIVNGENEQISALTGKLGRIDSINVKSALTAVEVENNGENL